jgi:hypothetical protein
MDLMPEGKKALKSFWEKPEGKVGIVISALFLAGGGLIFWAKILPWLLILAGNTITLAAMLIVAGILIFPFTQSDLRLKMSIAYKLFLTKIINTFIIKTDPIAVMKILIKRGQHRLEVFEGERSKLKQILSNLLRKISTYKEEAKDNLIAAQKAKELNIKRESILSANQAGRLQGAAVELTAIASRLQIYYKVLDKLYENASILLTDKQQEVKLLEDKWISIRAAYSAMKSAENALKGNKDERALFEETAEYINNDLGMKVGEIEFMLESAETIMDNIDVRNGVLQEKGMQMLEEFEKKADSWLLGSDQPSVPTIKTNDIGQIVSEEADRPNKFSDLFAK